MKNIYENFWENFWSRPEKSVEGERKRKATPTGCEKLCRVLNSSRKSNLKLKKQPMSQHKFLKKDLLYLKAGVVTFEMSEVKRHTSVTENLSNLL